MPHDDYPDPAPFRRCVRCGHQKYLHEAAGPCYYCHCDQYREPLSEPEDG